MFMNREIICYDVCHQKSCLLMIFFEPMTWYHQRRPFIRALTYKTAKTHRGWPAEPPPTIKSVQYLCEEGRLRERERKRRWRIDPASVTFVLLFISLHAICPFCPYQAQGPMETSDIFSDLI
jgi:hypothetical protein